MASVLTHSVVTRGSGKGVRQRIVLSHAFNFEMCNLNIFLTLVMYFSVSAVALGSCTGTVEYIQIR